MYSPFKTIIWCAGCKLYITHDILLIRMVITDKTTLTYTPASPDVFPRVAIPAPPRKYPEWLEARLLNENSPIPETVLAEDRPKIEPWMPQVAMPGRIFGAHEEVPALYVPPPIPVSQRPMVSLKFKVKNAFNKPIFGFGIRVNDRDLMTDENGEASMSVYQGHAVEFSTGRESGWTIPKGAQCKVRMTGMVPMAQRLTVNAPETIVIYPEAGEYSVGGRTICQPITYMAS